MKIVTIVRTLNEERNIERFLDQYSPISDLVIVADGGSDDLTVPIAETFKNVKVVYFGQKIGGKLNPKILMNPESAHLNFAINCAKEEGADWIIYDDCDCYPNASLKRKAREIIESTDKDRILVNRLYLWLSNDYFPEQTPGQSLWAWKPDKHNLWAFEGNPYQIDIREDAKTPTLSLDYPYCLLHNFTQDEKYVKEKMDRYLAWGYPHDHPLKRCGKVDKLPFWARI